MRIHSQVEFNFIPDQDPQTVTIPPAFRQSIQDTQSSAKNLNKETNLFHQTADIPVLKQPTSNIEFTQFYQQMKDFFNVDKQSSLNKNDPFSSDNQQNLSPEEKRSEYSKDFNIILNAYAKQYQLSTDDMKKLQFSFFNPETELKGNASNGQSLTEIKQSLLNITQNITSSNGVDISQLSPLIDNTAFNLNVSDGYNSEFEKLVDQNSSLTFAQKGQIIFMHYNPEIILPRTDPTIVNTLKNFENQALLLTQQKFGAPENWKPNLNNELYNGVLKSQFAVNLQIALNTYSTVNHSSAEDIKLIKMGIENPNANLPANIQEAIKEILGNAISATKVQNNLPINWKPSSLENIFSQIENDKTTMVLVNTREMISDTIKTLNLIMPDGPQKAKTLDLLQSVSSAIILMQKTIYEVEQAHSDVARNESIAKKGAQELQIRLQEAQNKEVADQLKKQESMGAAMAILGPIMKAFEFLMTLASGGALAAVFAILDSQFNFVQQGVTETMKGVAQLVDIAIPNATGNPDVERIKHGIVAMTKIMTIVAMAYVATSAMGSIVMNAVGPQQIVNISIKIVTESGIVQDFCQMVGISKKDADYVNMAVGIALTLAIAIASCINPSAGVTGLGKAAAKSVDVALKTEKTISQIIKDTLNVIKDIKIVWNLNRGTKIENILETAQEIKTEAIKSCINFISDVLDSVLNGLKSVKIFNKIITSLEKFANDSEKVQKIFNRLMRASSLAQGVLGATATALQGGIAISQAKVALSKGKYESEIAEIQQMIKVLQKMIDAILDGLADFGDQLNELKGLFDNLINSLSQTLQKTTSIHG